MQRSKGITGAVIVLTLTALALGACSSDKKSGGSSGSQKLSGTVTDKGTKTVSGSSITIEADDFYFSPTYIKAKAGSKITIDLKNEGKAPHTFTSDQLHVDQQLSPDQKATVTVTVPASGMVEFHCRFHGSSGMRGAIIAT